MTFVNLVVSISIIKNFEVWELIIGTLLTTGTALALFWKRVKACYYYLLSKTPYMRNSKRIEATLESHHNDFIERFDRLTISVESVLVNQVKQGARIKRIEDTLPISTFNTDENGLYTSVNDTFMQLTGRPEEDLLGKNWIITIVPEDRERIEKAWFSAVFDNRIFEDRYYIFDRDGEKRRVYSIAKPVICERKKLVGWNGKIYEIASEN